MRLRRYCVTVMDDWARMRDFWTLEGAKKFYREHRSCANVWKWEDGCWNWMCGANDYGTKSALSRNVTSETSALLQSASTENK